MCNGVRGRREGPGEGGGDREGGRVCEIEREREKGERSEERDGHTSHFCTDLMKISSLIRNQCQYHHGDKQDLQNATPPKYDLK